MQVLLGSPSPSRRRAVRSLLRWLFVGSVALAAVSVPLAASAYCRTTICPSCEKDEKGCPSGKPIAWPSSCVTYSLHYLASKQVDLAAATQVFEQAFTVWQDISCANTGQPPAIHIDHRYGNVACALHEYNQTDANANIIVFRDDHWPYEASDNVLALTTVTYSNRSGFIFDVDMEVNSTQPISVGDPVSSTSYDLQSIMTHEAGHFLGLAHSTDSEATMWPQYSAGSMSFRVLAIDDAEGICAVYPQTAAAKCDYAPRQGFATECGIFPSGGSGHCTLASRGPADQSNAHRWVGLVGTFAAIGLASRRWRRRRQSSVGDSGGGVARASKGPRRRTGAR